MAPAEIVQSASTIYRPGKAIWEFPVIDQVFFLLFAAAAGEPAVAAQAEPAAAVSEPSSAPEAAAASAAPTDDDVAQDEATISAAAAPAEEEVHCRYEAVTGSHFRQRVCRTDRQRQAAQDQAEETLRRARRTSTRAHNFE
jgi:pyruvate/2-oxoglutarate dehydrogenase complex dihydrolipoamide acyltransferase (E2) component